jgi:hypothetical protein
VILIMWHQSNLIRGPTTPASDVVMFGEISPGSWGFTSRSPTRRNRSRSTPRSSSWTGWPPGSGDRLPFFFLTCSDRICMLPGLWPNARQRSLRGRSPASLCACDFERLHAPVPDAGCLAAAKNSVLHIWYSTRNNSDQIWYSVSQKLPQSDEQELKEAVLHLRSDLKKKLSVKIICR